jgi:hypothetical protein
VKHFSQRRHVSETASLNSDTREKLWFTNVKPDNSLVPAGRNVYRKKYPKKVGSPIPTGRLRPGDMKFLIDDCPCLMINRDGYPDGEQRIIECRRIGIYYL